MNKSAKKKAFGLVILVGFILTVFVINIGRESTKNTLKKVQNDILISQLKAAILGYRSVYDQDFKDDNPTVYRTLEGDNARKIEFMKFRDGI